MAVPNDRRGSAQSGPLVPLARRLADAADALSFAPPVAFVWNWCPLGFLDAGGRNLTPDKLPRAERAALEALCDAALAEVVATLEVQRVIAIGAVAEAAVRRALAGAGRDAAAIAITRIPHPSPASPAANRDWTGQVEAALAADGVEIGESGADS